MSAVRLPSGRVTVLLGSDRARSAVVSLLDDSARCAGGHSSPVVRVAEPVPASPLPLADVLSALAAVPRHEAELRTALDYPELAAALETPTALLDEDVRTLAALAAAALRGPAAVVVERLRVQPSGLAPLARAGAAVLVDAADPVAALSTADAALRIGDDGSVAYEDLALTA